MKLFDLKLGYSCNNKCTHCVITGQRDDLIKQGKKYDLTFTECESLIKSQVESGIDGIVITGGEPTIRPDLSELLLLCEGLGLWIVLQTNGRRLMRRSLQEIYPKLSNFKALIAIHGSKPETHDQITLVKNSFEQTCGQLSEYLSYGLNATIKVVINKSNMHELADIVRLVNDLGGKSINFAYPHGLGDAKKNFVQNTPSYSELQPYLLETIKVAKDLNVNIEFEAVPFCIIPNHLTLVGELKYAMQEIYCTPVNQKEFIWDEVRLEIKSKGKFCSGCDFNKICEGPWSEYIEFFGDHELKPLVTGNLEFKSFIKLL